MENNIQNELAALKSQVRTLRRWLGLFALVAITALTISANEDDAIPDVIKARKVMVVNLAGKEVVSMETGAGGNGVLRVFNKAGQEAARMNANENGGLIGILNKDGQAVAKMLTVESGGVITVYNNNGQAAAGIGAREDGGGPCSPASWPYRCGH